MQRPMRRRHFRRRLAFHGNLSASESSGQFDVPGNGVVRCQPAAGTGALSPYWCRSALSTFPTLGATVRAPAALASAYAVIRVGRRAEGVHCGIDDG